MKRFLIKIVALFFYFNIQFLAAQVVYKEVKAKIDVEEIENTLSVVGTVENLKSEFKNISFKLSVFRKNKSNSNRSSNAQDGRVTLEPLNKITLSKTQINKSTEDQIIILLLIYDEDNKIIGKDRIIFGGEDSNLGILKPKDGLEMVGIVSNDTKTKLGNDFYDLFYNAFSKLKLNSSKIISIQEELTFGRTTKISINVDSEVIEEFIAKPDEDFLKFMAETSSAKVFKYFKNIEKQNKFITQY
jgi:hypothetical protein